MNVKNYLLIGTALLSGILLGWVVNIYFEKNIRQSSSVIYLDKAINAAKNDEPHIALEYAAQAVLLDPESYLAVMKLAELEDRLEYTASALEHYETALNLIKTPNMVVSNLENYIRKRIHYLTIQLDNRRTPPHKPRS